MRGGKDLVIHFALLEYAVSNSSLVGVTKSDTGSQAFPRR